jgi:hypothetical protein
MEGERFCTPHLSRSRRRFVRDFSIDDLLGVIPAPPLNTPAKEAAKAERVQQAKAEGIDHMGEMTAAMDAALCLGKGDSGKSRRLEKSANQARAIRSISPIPAKRHQQLPHAA